MRYLFISLLALASTSCFAESEKSFLNRLSVDELVDTLWTVSFSGLPVVDSIVNELLIRAVTENSFKAHVNGLQGRGENFFTFGKLDSAVHYYEQALTLAKREGNKYELAQCMISLGSIKRDRNEPAAAISLHNEAIEIWKELKDTSQLCATLVRKGGVEVQFDWMKEAMNSSLEAIECCESINDRLYVAHAYNNLITVHRVQKNYIKALEMSDSCLAIYNVHGDEGNVAMQYNNRGVILKNMKRYDEARISYLKGLNMMMKTDSEGRYYRAFHTNLGILDNLENRPDSAIYHCSKSYFFNLKYGLSTPMSDCLNEIAKALMTKGKLQAAADTIASSIKLAQDGFALEKEMDARKTQSEIFQKIGNFEMALEASEAHRALSDSLFAQKKSNEIDRLQAIFDSEKKDQSIAYLAKQHELEQDKNKWLRIGMGGLVAAALLVVFGIVQKRSKDKEILVGQLALERSERVRLDEQLDFKKRELTEKALHLAQKNELLQVLKSELEALRTSEIGSDVLAISNKIRFDQQIDNNWDQFTKAFTDTNVGFFDRLRAKHPEASKSEIRLSALLSMNLSSKEVGTILSISDEGVRKARYRLRKRLELRTEDKLEQYLASI